MSSDDASVTSVAGPSVVRERMPDIERGMVLAGRYQVEAIIGKGGSGIVLRAFDRTAQTVVAVKVLKQELVHDERWSKRFSRELRLGRPIRHPNVCRIFDIGEGDGYRFLTMELANGGTLRDLIKRGEPLRPLAERLADAAAAIAGLAAIHEAGIVHRDVKPDNMLRMDDGRLVLSDFGLATDLPTAAAVTVMVGTPHYMAPEVRAGRARHHARGRLGARRRSLRDLLRQASGEAVIDELRGHVEAPGAPHVDAARARHARAVRAMLGRRSDGTPCRRGRRGPAVP